MIPHCEVCPKSLAQWATEYSADVRPVCVFLGYKCPDTESDNQIESEESE